MKNDRDKRTTGGSLSFKVVSRPPIITLKKLSENYRKLSESYHQLSESYRKGCQPPPTANLVSPIELKI